MKKKIFMLIIVVVLLSIALPTVVFGNEPAAPVEFTILHTNDFHGRLEPDYKGRGGSKNIAGVVNNIRRTLGDENVVLLDVGDEYFAAPAISQLLLGESVIDIFNMMGYDVAEFGNHEFDKGQDVIIDRVNQSEYPWLGANIVLEGTDWDQPDWVKPYEILTVGEGDNTVRLGIIGVDTDETPQVTLIGTTEGLVFKDMTETILHYYDEVMAQSDALIVMSHMGTEDSGGFKGLETVAQELIDAGKPVDLILGGHQHQPLFEPVMVGDTAIIEAGKYGRWLGRADVSVDPATKKLSIVNYELITITEPDISIQTLYDEVVAFFEDGQIVRRGIYKGLLDTLTAAQAAYDAKDLDTTYEALDAFIFQVTAQAGGAISLDAATSLVEDAQKLESVLPDPVIAERVAYWADVVAPIVNQPVGATNIDLFRDYNNESNMGDIVTDAMLWKADWYDDGELNGSVDVVFTNPGGLRSDIIIPEGADLPYTITWGMTFEILPFGNTLYYMDLTGTQIQELLDQSASLYKGILQTSGAYYEWYNNTGDQNATEYGAYNAMIGGEPLDPDKVYRVVTNNFLAGGQDGWVTFAEGTNRWDSYYDMQEGFVEYLEMLEVVDAEDIPMDRIIKLDAPPNGESTLNPFVADVGTYSTWLPLLNK